MCGGVAHCFSTAIKWLSEPKKCCQGILADIEHSVILWSMFAFWDCATPPHVHQTCPARSLHVISFTSPFPHWYCKRQMLGWEGLGMAMFLVSYPNTVAHWCGKVSDVHLVILNPKKIAYYLNSS